MMTHTPAGRGGGICLLVDLVIAFYSNRSVVRSDSWLHVGMWLSAIGAALQTVGALLVSGH